MLRSSIKTGLQTSVKIKLLVMSYVYVNNCDRSYTFKERSALHKGCFRCTVLFRTVIIVIYKNIQPVLEQNALSMTL